jgi:hypothetical protein
MEAVMSELFDKLAERVTLDAQITELKRELVYRHRVYPRLIEAGRLHYGVAERQKARLKAAIATLEGLKNGDKTGV